MASVPLGQVNAPQPGPALLGAVHEQGSASHPYASAPQLLSGPEAARNLADAIHFLCALHGRYPGVIELVAMRTVEPGARAWLGETAEAFARERAYLASLAVQAGPVPATPGAGSEAAVAMQRNAVMTLAQSERRGCAIGAALAVAADWSVVRRVLDCAATRFGLNAPAPWRSGDPDAVEAVIDTLTDSPSVGRAALFGAEQVAIQHRGLWDLLAARAAARSA
jgi:hypothetical protein